MAEQTCAVTANGQLSRCGTKALQVGCHPLQRCIRVIYCSREGVLWCQPAWLSNH